MCVGVEQPWAMREPSPRPDLDRLIGCDQQVHGHANHGVRPWYREIRQTLDPQTANSRATGMKRYEHVIPFGRIGSQ